MRLHSIVYTNANVLDEDVSVPALARLRYRFQGREWSAATGLMNFRMRWYDPDTGRWLSKDPIGLSGGLNLYAFCGNRPLYYCDWIGWCPSEDESSWLDRLQNVIDGIGVFDPTPVCDGINAIIYASRGKWPDTTISLAGMLPYLGDLAKAGKYGNKGRKIFKSTNSFARKQVDNIATKFGIKGVDRKLFGKYIKKTKKSMGRGGADNFSWEELEDLAREFINSGGR